MRLHVIQIRTEMQTSVTVKKSVLLSCKRNEANIIAAQLFTVPEWYILACASPQARRAYCHYRECLLLQQSSNHAYLLVRVVRNMSELSHI